MNEDLSIEDPTRIVVSAEEFDALLARLDEPAQDKPALRELFSEADPWVD